VPIARRPCFGPGDHGLEDRDASVWLGLGGDDVPRRDRVVGRGKHLFGCLRVVGAVREVAPVLAGELPVFARVVFAGAEATQLLVFGDVDSELDQDQPFACKPCSHWRICG